ncbi:MAG: DUF4091 domain-containing protein [bacterium]|nr:DUF4091 domain-containing protein [bacterium]
MKMNLPYICAAAALVFLTGCGSPSSAALPLNGPNGSFENGKGALPSGWSNYASPGTKASFVWSDDMGHTGKRSLYIKNEGPNTALWQTEIPVVSGAEYTVKVWARTKNARGKADIRLQGDNAAGKMAYGNKFSSASEDIFLEGSTGWQQISYRVRFSAEVVKARLFLTSGAGQGDEVWFDDLEVSDNVVESFNLLSPGVVAEIKSGLNKLKGQYPREKSEKALALVSGMESTMARIRDAGDLSVEQKRDVWELLSKGVSLQREISREAFRAGLKKNGRSGSLEAVWVDSMQKVFIDDMPLEKAADKGRLEVFPGERECIQLVMVPFRGMEDIRIKFRKISGKLPEESISWKVVGYVKIDKPARNHYRTEPFPYAGWWPDPLLKRESFPLKDRTFQPVWIEVKVPEEKASGLSTYEVVAEGRLAGDGVKSLWSGRMDIEVLPGRLPDKWYMKKFLCFSEATASGKKGYANRLVYGEKWDKVADKYYDLLLDYRVGIGSLDAGVLNTPRDKVKEAAARGQNAFLASTIARARYDDEGGQVLKLESLNDLRRTEKELAPWLKESGLLPVSYFYGFDEQKHEYFDYAREIFSEVKEKTGLKIVSTINDHSYGNDSVLSGVVDAFMPTMALYNREEARKAHARGREVWWYTTMDNNIESDGVYMRLLCWRTMAVEADGYLIWTMNRWVDNKQFISSEIRSEWNPYLDGVCPSSSGMLIYPGPDGPVSSIRLENMRDGIEDYDLLADAALRLKGKDQSFHDAAGALLSRLGLKGDLSGLTPEEMRGARKNLSRIISGM